MQTQITELLIEAATLMLAGMAFVFVFLTILIGAVKLISVVNNALPAEQQPASPSAKRTSTTPTNNHADAAVNAAISAAVHQYRKEHQA